MQSIMLCGRPGKCCPVFGKEGKYYSIRDKGQKIMMTKEQLKILGNEIQKELK